MSCVPYVSVQHDYPQVFDDIAQGTVAAERVWASVYALNAPSASIHARILLVSDEPENVQGVAEQDAQAAVFIAEIKPEHQITLERVKSAAKDFIIASTFKPAQDSIAPPSTSARHLQQRIHLPPVRCIAPRLTIPYPASTSSLRLRKGVNTHISAFDLSPSGNGLYVAGGPDGKCWIGSLPKNISASDVPARSALQPSVVLEGHVGDITSARFFPSGEVVITTGSDFRVCIFSALPQADEDGTAKSPSVNAPVRTLTAHTRAPTCTAIVGKGRIVLSGGRDGLVRCWNVGEGREVGNLPASEAVLTSLFGPSIECMELGPETGSHATANEHSTAGAPDDIFPGPLPLLAIGLSTGEVALHDLRQCSLGEASPEPRSKPVRVQPSDTTRAVLSPPMFPPGPPLDASDPAQAWACKRSAGAASALAWDSTGSYLAVGYQSGITTIYHVPSVLQATVSDAGSGSAPAAGARGLVALWKRNEASITSIAFAPTSSSGDDGDVLMLVATTSDGLACRLRLLVPQSRWSSWSSAASSELRSTSRLPRAEDGEAPAILAVPELLDEYIGWESGDLISAARLVPGQQVGAGGHPSASRVDKVVLVGAEGALRLYDVPAAV